MTSDSSDVGVPEQDTNIESKSKPGSTANQAWVGSDATFHEFTENGFRNKSEIAVAIAVDNRDEFNTKYRNIIAEKAEEYGFSPKRPVLKTHAIRSNASEWDYDSILSDFVGELLTMDNILNIHTTITTITNQMIQSYSEVVVLGNTYRAMRSMAKLQIITI